MRRGNKEDFVLRKLSVLSVPVIISAIAVSMLLLSNSSVSADSPTNCAVEAVNLSNGQGSQKSFTISGTTATSSFTVTGDPGCNEAVTIAAWQAPNGSTDFLPLAQQKLVSSNTNTFTPGSYTISVQIPNCDYQIDLLRGSSPAAADGTANYVAPQLIDWVEVSNTVCEPPATTSAVTTPPVAQPTSLASTGPGNVLGLFVFTTLVAGITHRIYVKRRHNKVNLN